MKNYKIIVLLSAILINLSLFGVEKSRNKPLAETGLTTKLAVILDTHPTLFTCYVKNNTEHDFKIFPYAKGNNLFLFTTPSGRTFELAEWACKRAQIKIPSGDYRSTRLQFKFILERYFFYKIEEGFYKLNYSVERHLSNEIPVFIGDYDKYQPELIGNDVKLNLFLLLDSSPSTFVISLENMSKDSLKTTPFGIDDNLLLITTPDGKTVEYSKDNGRSELVVVPPKSKKDWTFELTSIFKELSLTDAGFYSIQWKCEDNVSNEMLVFLKKPLDEK